MRAFVGERAKQAIWVGQGVLAIVLIVFVWRAIARDTASLRAVGWPDDLRLIPLLAALVLIATAYGLLIDAWRTILGGWHQRLDFVSATRIWCVSNLGRYVPGKVWSVAGLAVLAQRAGVSAWAATGSAVVMQALSIATGVTVVVALLPGSFSPILLAIAGLFAAFIVVFLTSSRGMAAIGRLVPGENHVRPLPWLAAARGGGAALAAWILYGLAFRALALGLQSPGVPSVQMALGVFPAGYIVGLLALFAPGGLVVREGVFTTLLAPSIGSGSALVLSIASRLLLTFTEVAAALVGLGLSRFTRETPRA